MIAICLGCFGVLHQTSSLSLLQLRIVELLLVGSVAIQMTAMPVTLMLQRAEVGDYATVVMDAYFVQGLSLIHI